ncbi:MAG: acyl-CoA dehydrogenase family protein [Dehalococcoidia bacterium]|jgi:alkylation response protein AidB-like acyl-CoA dehydrogenase|nr:acyl-CoA dehydrogenase family protein [Dehalococcoidia bacterium]
MDLSLSEDQEMLRKMARDFLANECPKTLVREMEEDEKGYSPELWAKMAEQGWTGLPFPEKYGGVGYSFLDLAVLLEEMGRACLPGPYFSTVVLAGGAIMEAGSEEQKQKLLGEISEGKLIATLALTEPSASYKANDIQVTAAAEGGGHVINGTKLFVPDANVADVMVVVARTGGQGAEGLTLFLVDPKASGVSITQLKTIASDKLCEVTFDKVKVGQDAVLGEVGKGWPMVETVLQKAAVAKCAEMVGGAQQVLEMTVNYSKERVQFGRPIGSFQAIQHHCANMAIDVDGSRFISYQAAWMLSEGMPSTKEVAMAKSWTSDAYRRLTALGHQVHGGIGFTKDHDMQLYYRRAKAAEVTFGDGDFHRDVVASEIGLPDPA